MRGGKQAINCGDGGISSNCPNWSDRHFFLRVLIGISYDFRHIRHSRSFFGWNPARKCGSAGVGGQVDALFRVNCQQHFSLTCLSKIEGALPRKCPVLIALLFLVAAFTHQAMIPIACAGFDEAVAAYDRGEFAAAYEEFKSLAEQGDADAQWNLGMMYYNGEGVEQDCVEAMKWFQKSVEQGDVDSQLGLGWMYANGKGIPQNLVLAHKWLNEAALQGSKAAMKGVDSVTRRPASAHRK